MKKQIVVINGTGHSGKDSFVNYVSEIAKTKNFDSVGKVKEIAKICGWDGEKTEEARLFLSELKRITTAYNDMSYKEILKGIEDFKSGDEEIMFIHIREPHEIQRIVDNFGAATLIVKRLGQENITSNSSDANVDQFDYDYYITNNHIDDMKDQAIDFVEQLRNRKNLTINPLDE